MKAERLLGASWRKLSCAARSSGIDLLGSSLKAFSVSLN